jgi:hypothetical protein
MPNNGIHPMGHQFSVLNHYAPTLRTAVREKMLTLNEVPDLSMFAKSSKRIRDNSTWKFLRRKQTKLVSAEISISFTDSHSALLRKDLKINIIPSQTHSHSI